MPRTRKVRPKAKAAGSPPPGEKLQLRETAERFPLLWSLRAAGALFMVFAVIGSIHPEWRLWGFTYPTFLSEPLGFGLLIAGVLLLSPFGGRLASRLLPRLALLRNRSVWIWALVTVAVLYGLRISVPLLGDSQLWIRELTWIGEFSQKGTNVPLDRVFKRKEPLSLALHEAVFYVAASFTPVPVERANDPNARWVREERLNRYRDLARDVYAYLSMLAGALTVLILLRFARKFISPEQRAPFFLLFLTGGGTLLFFGYVENYTWTSFWIIACMLAGIEESLPPRRMPLKTIGAFMIAVGFHFSSIVLLPGVLHLLINLHFQPADRKAGRSDAPRQRARMLAVALLAAGVLGYLWVKGWRGWISIIPLLPQWSKDGYSFVSLAHWIDLLNLFGLAALGACAVFFALRPAKESGLEEQTLNGFLWLTAGSGALFAILFNPNLGMARDWDLYAAALWPLVAAAAWKLSQARSVNRAAVIASLLGLICMIALPSALVNAQYDPSVARFKALLALDRSRAAYGWENLALHYQRRGLLENRIEAWRQAMEIERNPRYVFNYADALKLAGRLEEAEPYYLEAALAMRESDNRIYREQLLYLAAGLIGKERFDRARHVLEVTLELMPNHEYALRLMAMIDDAELVNRLIADGSYDAAREAALAAREKDPQNSYWVKMLNKIRKLAEERGEG